MVTHDVIISFVQLLIKAYGSLTRQKLVLITCLSEEKYHFVDPRIKVILKCSYRKKVVFYLLT